MGILDRFRSFVAPIFAMRLTRAPNYPGESGRFYNRPMSGVVVTPDTALRISTVWACHRYITQTVAQLPARVMREDGAKSVRVARHPVAAIFSWRANPELSPFQLKETLTGWALLRGNGIAEIETDGSGRVVNLWPIHPDRVTFLRDRDTGELIYRVVNGTHGSVDLTSSQVFHLRGFGHDAVGLSVVEYAAESIGWAKATELFGAAFFGNGINSGGVIEVGGKLTDDGKDLLRETAIQRNAGPKRAHLPLILDAGMKWIRNTFAPNEAQFVETMQHQIEEICFIPGTEIITPHGPKPIESMIPGEMVLTHRGRWRRVKHVMCRDYVGTVVTARAKGLKAVTATANHPFYVQPMKATRANQLEAIGEPDWVDAGELIPVKRNADGRRGRSGFHALTIPRLSDVRMDRLDMAEWATDEAVSDETSIKASTNGRATAINRRPLLDYDFGWLCGLFASEGSTTDHQSVFYIGSHEQDITDALVSRLSGVFGASSTSTETAGNVTRTVVSHRILAKFFRDFGSESHEKRLPGWCMAAGPDFARGLIDGLVDGDGCVYEKRSQLRTTSSALAWQLRTLLWATGVNSTLQETAAGVWEINGRSGVSREIMTVEWREDQERRGTMGCADGHVYFNLDEAMRSTYAGKVYNLEVEEDESYTTVGGCVHNCRWFGCPPQKVGHLLRMTFNNVEQLSIEVVVDNITPWCIRWEEESNFKLFGQNRLNFFLKLDLKGLLRGAFKDRQEGLQIMRNSGVIHANDWRELEDMGPQEGNSGHKYIVNAATTTLDRVGEVPVPTPQPQTPAPEPAPAPAKKQLPASLMRSIRSLRLNAKGLQNAA